MGSEEIHASSRFASSLVEKVKNENLKAMDASKLRRERMCIIMGRVPCVVRQQKEKAYSPSTISIGPLHRGKEGLQDMEPVKFSYTHDLLGRVGALEETMEHCAAAMLEIEEDVWNSYDAASLPPKTQENVRWLAEVILIDACFIIELLWRNSHLSKYLYDPILGNSPKYFAVQRDMVLVENQIPFSVLQKLFELTVEKIPSKSDQQYSLTQWVLDLFSSILVRYRLVSVENTDKYYHILHLLHIYLRPQQSNEREHDEIEKMERRMKYSATELRLAGVEFKAGNDRNLFDINFTKSFSFISCWFMFRKGHIEIPPFYISDNTESFLRNLIALELSCPSIGSHFTSFAFLMDLLIDTPEDVKLLEEAGIIHNLLLGSGSDDEVAGLFNGICSNATAASGFHFSEEYQKAMKFCKHRCRVAIKNLRQDYFGNPWTGISVIVAIILFVLTSISTIYTVLSYYH